jgi:diguanylate cyclase (GGDEF)-like protein
MLGLGLAVVYAAIAWMLSFFAAFGNSAGAPASFWPAAGVTVVALARSPRRNWPWLLAGIWTAEVAFDLHNHLGLWVSSGWGLANVVEPLCSVLLLARLRRSRPDLTRQQDLVPFVLCAVVAGPAMGAVVGAATAALSASGAFGINALRWFVGDSIGVLVVAPALLLLLDHREQLRPGRPALIFIAVTAAALGFVPLSHRYQASVAFLVVPALIWLAFRGGQRRAALGVLFVSLVTNFSTAAGWGPFALDQGAFSGLIVAQVFLATTAFSAFMVAILSSDLVRRDEVGRRLRDQATHDALTGLANRRLLFETLAQPCPGLPSDLTALLMVDLDGFKEVNDSLGHAAGDAVLVECARRLESATRPDDMVARLGGDEFLVRLSLPGSPETVRTFAARLTDLLARPMTIQGRDIAVGASIGVAVSRRVPADMDALLRAADEDLYAVKRRRNGVRGENPSTGLTDPADRELAADLAAAFEHNELHLEFQPEFLLGTGTLYGLEALARWKHPTLGSIPPDRFILVAEASGLIVTLGEWALTEACMAWRAFHEAHPQHPDIQMAVNVSPHQLNDPGLFGHVVAALSKSGIPPRCLTLEITESALVHDHAATLALLWRLKNLGIRFAMDDFGTGYSTLSYLVRLPLDMVKIDRSLVEAAGDSERNAALVSSMISMVQGAGLAVIVEGLETRDQAVLFKSMGCDVAQGYLLARPAQAVFDDLTGMEQRVHSILNEPTGSGNREPSTVRELTALVVKAGPRREAPGDESAVLRAR